MSLEKASEAFDKQQAFAVGFALAARDAGLSADEHEQMCKIASERMLKEAAATPPAPAAPAPIVPIENAAQQADAKRQDFIKQKAQQLVKTQPVNQPKAASAVLGTLLKINAAAPVKAPVKKPASGPGIDSPLPPPKFNDPPMVPEGQSVFDPKNAATVAKAVRAERQKTLNPKQIVQREGLGAVANLEKELGLAPPPAAQKVESERQAEIATANKGRADQLAAQRAKLQQRVSKLPPVDAKATSPGAIGSGLAKFLKNPSL